MILIDEAMPGSCLNCFAAAGYGCAVTGEILESRKMIKPPRPESCPLIEAVPEERRVRDGHVSYKTETVYVRKEERHDR